MDTVQQQLYANIDDSSVEKCTRFIVKHLQKASASGNISTLTRTLYQIGGLAAPRGEKRKNSGVITVQAASKSWRLHSAQAPREWACHQWQEGEGYAFTQPGLQ